MDAKQLVDQLLSASPSVSESLALRSFGFEPISPEDREAFQGASDQTVMTEFDDYIAIFDFETSRFELIADGDPVYSATTTPGTVAAIFRQAKVDQLDLVDVAKGLAPAH